MTLIKTSKVHREGSTVQISGVSISFNQDLIGEVDESKVDGLLEKYSDLSRYDEGDGTEHSKELKVSVTDKKVGVDALEKDKVKTDDLGKTGTADLKDSSKENGSSSEEGNKKTDDGTPEVGAEKDEEVDYSILSKTELRSTCVDAGFVKEEWHKKGKTGLIEYLKSKIS